MPPLTDEEAAQLAALQAKQSEPAAAEEVAATVVETIGDVAETVAAVVAREVGDAHEQATAAVVDQASNQLAHAELERDIAQADVHALESRVIHAEESQETERAEIYADAAPEVVEVPVVVNDVEALSVDDDGEPIVEVTHVETPDGDDDGDRPRRSWKHQLLGTYGHAK